MLMTIEQLGFSLKCQTYCDTRHPFIIVISENLWHSRLLPSVWQYSCHWLFSCHGCDSNTQSSMRGERPNQLLHRRCVFIQLIDGKENISLVFEQPSYVMQFTHIYTWSFEYLCRRLVRLYFKAAFFTDTWNVIMINILSSTLNRTNCK